MAEIPFAAINQRLSLSRRLFLGSSLAAAALSSHHQAFARSGLTRKKDKRAAVDMNQQTIPIVGCDFFRCYDEDRHL